MISPKKTKIKIIGMRTMNHDNSLYPALQNKSKTNVQNNMYIAFNARIMVLLAIPHLYEPTHNVYHHRSSSEFLITQAQL